MDKSGNPFQDALDSVFGLLDFRHLDRALQDLDSKGGGVPHGLVLFLIAALALMGIGILVGSLSLFIGKMMALEAGQIVPEYEPFPSEMPLHVPLSLAIVWLLSALLPEWLGFLLMRRIGGTGSLDRQMYLSGAIALCGALAAPILLLSFVPCIGFLPAIAYLLVTAYLALYAKAKAYTQVHALPFLRALLVAIGIFVISSAISLLLDQAIMDAFNITSMPL